MLEEGWANREGEFIEGGLREGAWGLESLEGLERFESLEGLERFEGLESWKEVLEADLERLEGLEEGVRERVWKEVKEGEASEVVPEEDVERPSFIDDSSESSKVCWYLRLLWFFIVFRFMVSFIFSLKEFRRESRLGTGIGKARSESSRFKSKSINSMVEFSREGILEC